MLKICLIVSKIVLVVYAVRELHALSVYAQWRRLVPHVDRCCRSTSLTKQVESKSW